MTDRSISHAVISGADAAGLATLLQDHVKSITTVATVAELAAATGDMAPGSVDLYVQLPVRVPNAGENAVEVVRNFLTDGLIRRFDAVSAMLTPLAPNATVALVTGNHPPTSGAPDNPEARIALMKVLAHTLLLERGASADTAGRVEVKILSGVLDESRLVELILTPQERSVSIVNDIAEAEPTLDYSDWRDAIMALDETHA